MTAEGRFPVGARVRWHAVADPTVRTGTVTHDWPANPVGGEYGIAGDDCQPHRVATGLRTRIEPDDGAWLPAPSLVAAAAREQAEEYGPYHPTGALLLECADVIKRYLTGGAS